MRRYFARKVETVKRSRGGPMHLLLPIGASGAARTSIGAMGRTKRSFAVTKFAADGTRDTRAGQVEVEEPLEIRAGGASVATLTRTPGHDIELAHGLLLANGLIARAEDVVAARYCEGAIGGENTYNLLDIQLARRATPQFIDPIPGDACGISVEQRVRELASSLNVRAEFMTIDPPAIFALPALLAKHRARDLPTAVAGDVGRQDLHSLNAVHKIAGSVLLDDVPSPTLPLIVDAKVGFETVRAAVAAGFGAVATTAGVTSMAVELARATNTVLIGNIGAERFSVYSGA